MNTDEIDNLIRSISYKPGWSIHYGKDKEFDHSRTYLQVTVSETAEASMDSRPPHTRKAWKGAKHYLSPHMCRQEIIGVAFGAIRAAEDHEMREWFRYRGVSIYNPHLDPDFLADAIKFKGKAAFNVRAEAMSMREPT